MGYALLYESMLPSVLFARDKYLKDGGVMAPSQCRMELGLVDIPVVMRERVTFWDEVYGWSRLLTRSCAQLTSHSRRRIQNDINGKRDVQRCAN